MCKKVQFSKKEAQTALNNRKTRGKQWSKECRYYYCEYCNKWHLTSKTEWEQPVKLELGKLKYAKKWKRLQG